VRDVVDIALEVEGRVHHHPIVEPLRVRLHLQEVAASDLAIDPLGTQCAGQLGLDLDAVDPAVEGIGAIAVAVATAGVGRRCAAPLEVAGARRGFEDCQRRFVGLALPGEMNRRAGMAMNLR
jgi:hypothetical protein